MKSLLTHAVIVEMLETMKRQPVQEVPLNSERRAVRSGRDESEPTEKPVTVGKRFPDVSQTLQMINAGLFAVVRFESDLKNGCQPVVDISEARRLTGLSAKAIIALFGSAHEASGTASYWHWIDVRAWIILHFTSRVMRKFIETMEEPCLTA